MDIVKADMETLTKLGNTFHVPRNPEWEISAEGTFDYISGRLVNVLPVPLGQAGHLGRQPGGSRTIPRAYPRAQVAAATCKRATVSLACVPEFEPKLLCCAKSLVNWF